MSQTEDFQKNPINYDKVNKIKSDIEKLSLNELSYLLVQLEKKYTDLDNEEVSRETKRLITVKKAFVRYDELEREYENENK